MDEVGTSLHVYERPRTQFVFGFIGSPAMNLVPPDGQAVASGPPGTLVGTDGMLGIRPEDMRMGAPRNDGEMVGANTCVYGMRDGVRRG